MTILARAAWRASFTLAIALVLALGCSSGPSSFAVEAMRVKWERTEPLAYQYELHVGCFCPPDMLVPVTIVVDQGTVVRRFFTNSGLDLPDQYAGSFPDITGLFDRLEQAARSDPDVFEVEYDAHYGFPVRAHYNVDSRATDGGFSLLVFNFQPALMD